LQEKLRFLVDDREWRVVHEPLHPGARGLDKFVDHLRRQPAES
jgi:hypothetical protein